jgi:DNA repair exonuclease SbcCD ATPase subunit
MTELEQLDRTLRGLSGDVAKMQQPVDRCDTGIDETKSVLGKPKQLSRSMAWLASKARTLRYSALFLTPFPVIGTLAGRIAKILRSLKSTAEKCKRSADKLDRKIQPAKDAVAKLQPPIVKVKSSLDRAQALLQGWLAVTAEMQRRFEERLPESVEFLCAGINTALAPEVKAIAEKRAALAQSLNSVSAGFEGVVKAGKPVAQALAAGDDLVSGLRPLEGPLKALNKALRPVKWALDAVSWVTSKIIDPIVNEVLKAVGLKKLVNQLERKLNPLGRLITPLQRAVTSMANAVAGIGATSKLATSLNAIPAIERRIVAAMKPLGRLPAA